MNKYNNHIINKRGAYEKDCNIFNYQYLTIIAILSVFQHLVYADLIVTNDIFDLDNEKNNSTNNSMYSNSIEPSNTAELSEEIDLNNTIELNVQNKEKDNAIITSTLMSVGVVLIVVGISILVLNTKK